MSQFSTNILKSTGKGRGWIQGTVTNVVVTLVLAGIALSRLKSPRYETRAALARSRDHIPRPGTE